MQRWFLRLLMVVMLGFVTLGATPPAQANTGVIAIGPEEASEPVLPADQIARITSLSQPANQTLARSRISPDDRFMVITQLSAQGRSLRLLDIQDGASIQMPPVPNAFTPTELVWSDSRTLVGLTVVGEDNAAALARFDLRVGNWSLSPLPFPAENAISVAPNGSRVLLAVFQADQVIGFQVYVVATNQFIDVSGIDLKRTLQNLSWSPDGSQFAYTVGSLRDLDRPVNFRRLDGELLSSQITRDAAGQLPPAENPLFQRNELRLFDLTSGTMKVLRASEYDGTTFGNIAWSPDNNSLAVVVYYPAKPAGRLYPSYQYPSHSGVRFFDRNLKQRGAFEPNQLVADIQMASPDELIVSMFEANSLYAYYHNRVSGEVRRISDRQGVYSQLFITSSQKRQVVFSYEWFNHPNDLYRLNWDGTARYRLSWNNEGLRQNANLRADRVSFTLANGDVREGTLIQRADASFPPSNAKVVVYQEGGPLNPMTGGWASYAEAPWVTLPDAGFAVLHVPLYGRYGVGSRGFLGMMDNTNFGQIDIDAQADIVRQLFSRGWSRPGSVGIVGCSYGGYFVTQSLARHPGLYSAGHTMCSLIDTLTEWNRGYAGAMSFLQPKSTLDDPNEYLRDSPYYNASKIKTPLLIFHGTNDFLPVTLVENMYQTIRNNGGTATMYRFDGAGHGFLDGPPRLEQPLPRQVAQAYELFGMQQQIQWFRQYLK